MKIFNKFEYSIIKKYLIAVFVLLITSIFVIPIALVTFYAVKEKNSKDKKDIYNYSLNHGKISNYAKSTAVKSAFWSFYSLDNTFLDTKSFSSTISGSFTSIVTLNNSTTNYTISVAQQQFTIQNISFPFPLDDQKLAISNSSIKPISVNGTKVYVYLVWLGVLWKMNSNYNNDYRAPFNIYTFGFSVQQNINYHEYIKNSSLNTFSLNYCIFLPYSKNISGAKVDNFYTINKYIIS